MVLIVTMFLVKSALVTSAADWYDCKMVEIYEKKGHIIITVVPGADENGFMETSRIKINRKSNAANKDLAIILTAASMDYELMISLIDPPSWSPVQEPKALGFAMP